MYVIPHIKSLNWLLENNSLTLTHTTGHASTTLPRPQVSQLILHARRGWRSYQNNVFQVFFGDTCIRTPLQTNILKWLPSYFHTLFARTQTQNTRHIHIHTHTGTEICLRSSNSPSRTTTNSHARATWVCSAPSLLPPHALSRSWTSMDATVSHRLHWSTCPNIVRSYSPSIWRSARKSATRACEVSLKIVDNWRELICLVVVSVYTHTLLSLVLHFFSLLLSFSLSVLAHSPHKQCVRNWRTRHWNTCPPSAPTCAWLVFTSVEWATTESRCWWHTAKR